jgi:hypothetical protein
LIGFSKTAPGDFEKAHPSIELPSNIPRQNLRALQAFGSVTLPNFVCRHAWRFVFRLSFVVMYSIALTKIQFDLEAGVQTMLAGLFAAAANLCSDAVLLKRELIVADSTHGGPIEFVFVNFNGVINFIVEIKRDLRVGYKKHFQQLFHELYAAMHMNSKRNNGSSRDVKGVLMDADGAIFFQLTIDANGDGRISCTPYMYVFNGCSPAQHLPLFILHMLHAIDPNCHTMTEQQWCAKYETIERNEQKGEATSAEGS